MSRGAANNKRVGLICGGVVAGMIGLAYASVPLYDLFCKVTGFGGTTQRAEAAPGAQSDRTITVRFNADISDSLNWRFKPVTREITVKLGEEKLAFFEAVNLGANASMGTAVFNVTPQKVGGYFNKVQCFCFEEQVLQPGQNMDFPVSFFIDPEILDERNLDDVKTITLSYTFFPAKDVPASNTTASLAPTLAERR
jgi:cytochrome c oxidase assembly protein subunit 11